VAEGADPARRGGGPGPIGALATSQIVIASRCVSELFV